MTKVGEHITLDFIGVKKDYSQKFYEKIIYKIAKLAKVEILGITVISLNHRVSQLLHYLPKVI